MYYHWRKKYGGMRVERDRKLKELEKENARLANQFEFPQLGRR
jgi:hypothetical protein